MSGGGLGFRRGFVAELPTPEVAVVDIRAVEGTIVKRGVMSGCCERLWEPSML